MFAIGFFITIIGIIGTIWSKKTTIDLNGLFVMAINGRVPLKYRAMAFFYDYGIFVIILGVVIMIYGYKRYKNNKDKYN